MVVVDDPWLDALFFEAHVQGLPQHRGVQVVPGPDERDVRVVKGGEHRPEHLSFGMKG